MECSADSADSADKPGICGPMPASRHAKLWRQAHMQVCSSNQARGAVPDACAAAQRAQAAESAGSAAARFGVAPPTAYLTPLRTCSLLSSSTNSAGNRSDRVLDSWPNLMKVGPKLSTLSSRKAASLRVAAAFFSSV